MLTARLEGKETGGTAYSAAISKHQPARTAIATDAMATTHEPPSSAVVSGDMEAMAELAMAALIKAAAQA